MEGLISARISIYTNSELLTFASNILALLEKYKLDALNTVKEDFEMAYKDMNAAFKKEIGSLKTLSIKSLDKRRDQALKGIKANVQSYQYHFEEEKINARIIILRSMNKYDKNIVKLNYGQETAVINSLLEDWSNDEDLSNAIDLLGLVPWKAELTAANAAFEEAYRDRNEETAQSNTVTSVADTRTVLENSYRKLARRIDANIELNLSPELAALVGELNVTINKSNLEASRGGSRQPTTAPEEGE